MKQEVVVDGTLLLPDFDETWHMGVIDHGDSQYGIGSYVTSCFYVSTVKQEVADDTNMLLLDLDEIRCMGVIDIGDSQYGIGCYVTSCFECEIGCGC